MHLCVAGLLLISVNTSSALPLGLSQRAESLLLVQQGREGKRERAARSCQLGFAVGRTEGRRGRIEPSHLAGFLPHQLPWLGYWGGEPGWPHEAGRGAPFPSTLLPPALAATKLSQQLYAAALKKLRPGLEEGSCPCLMGPAQFPIVPQPGLWGVPARWWGEVPSPSPCPSLLTGASHSCWLDFAAARSGGQERAGKRSSLAAS